MKNTLTKITAALFIYSLSFPGIAQTDSKLLDELNEVLESSLYKSTIEIDNQYLLKRKDSNGNTFEYHLSDIKEVSCVNDGFHNVMIKLKEGKTSNGVVEGREVESKMNVIAFRSKANCDKAIDLLNALLEKTDPESDAN